LGLCPAAITAAFCREALDYSEVHDILSPQHPLHATTVVSYNEKKKAPVTAAIFGKWRTPAVMQHK
jgi:hypothetical protein